MKISFTKTSIIPVHDFEVEFVERKGIGHPDSLADGIAEAASRQYSLYCLNHFGVVANHWLDKCMLIGGECEVQFGYGKNIKPIRIYIVGKMTDKIGDIDIPVQEIVKDAVLEYLKSVLEILNDKDVEITMHTNSAVGAGRLSSWYRPEKK